MVPCFPHQPSDVVSGELVRILNALRPDARFTVYVDDILIVAESQAAANDAARFALDLIKRLGLRSSDEKFQPATRYIEYLGIVFDLTARPPVVRCKPEKLQEVQAALRRPPLRRRQQGRRRTSPAACVPTPTATG
jgi:hypothetical protein